MIDDPASVVSSASKIAEMIGRVSDLQAAIAGAVEEQSAMVGEIGRSISEAAKASDDIAHNIEAVAGSAQTTLQASDSTRSAGEALSRLALEIEDYASRFEVERREHRARAQAQAPGLLSV